MCSSTLHFLPTRALLILTTSCYPPQNTSKFHTQYELFKRHFPPQLNTSQQHKHYTSSTIHTSTMVVIENSITAPTVAFMTFPFGTHSAPLFALASALASASATRFTFFNSTCSNNSLRERYEVPSNLRLCDVEDGWPVGRPPSKDPEEEVRLFLDVSPGNFRAAMAAEGRRVNCIVSDAFLWFAADMAEEMDVPWIPVWTGGPASLMAHLNSDMLRAKFVAPNGQGLLCKDDQTLTCIPCLSSLQLRDLPEGLISGNLNSAFASMLRRMAKKLHNTKTIVINTFSGLNPSIDTELQTQFTAFLPVGPVNVLSPKPPQPDQHSSLSWLDNRAPKSVVYISFGTLISPSPRELIELAMGLEKSCLEFLWSLKDELRAHLPQDLLKRIGAHGLIVPWAPQIEVLGHVSVGAFMTHCGWNSILEGITGGVPFVCRPFLGDQKINARLVSHVWGVGVSVEGGVLTCDSVGRAFEKVVRGEEGRAMRERAGRLSEMAVQAVRTGGGSVQKFNELMKLVTGC